MILLSYDMDLVYLHASVSFLAGLNICLPALHENRRPLKAPNCNLWRVRLVPSDLDWWGRVLGWIFTKRDFLRLGSSTWKFAFGSLEPRSSKKLWREWNLAAIRCEIRMECLVQKATVGNKFGWKVSRREVGKQWQRQAMGNALFTACATVSQT